MNNMMNNLHHNQHMPEQLWNEICGILIILSALGTAVSHVRELFVQPDLVHNAFQLAEAIDKFDDCLAQAYTSVGKIQQLVEHFKSHVPWITSPTELQAMHASTQQYLNVVEQTRQLLRDLVMSSDHLVENIMDTYSLSPSDIAEAGRAPSPSPEEIIDVNSDFARKVAELDECMNRYQYLTGHVLEHSCNDLNMILDTAKSDLNHIIDQEIAEQMGEMFINAFNNNGS
jgi:hypothetical protein